MASPYVVDGTGKYIPATQRPDGTWRKARRVKDGYVPQEEVPLYESKGKQFAKSIPTVPPGYDPDEVAAVKARLLGQVATETELSKSAKKKKKRKAKAEMKVAQEGLQKLYLELSDSCRAEADTIEAAMEVTKKQQPIQMDPVKRLKNLKKKLRDIEKLESKVASGELGNPEKDQLEKIARKGEVEAEIAELEENT